MLDTYGAEVRQNLHSSDNDAIKHRDRNHTEDQQQAETGQERLRVAGVQKLDHSHEIRFPWSSTRRPTTIAGHPVRNTGYR